MKYSYLNEWARKKGFRNFGHYISYRQGNRRKSEPDLEWLERIVKGMERKGIEATLEGTNGGEVSDSIWEGPYVRILLYLNDPKYGAGKTHKKIKAHFGNRRVAHYLKTLEGMGLVGHVNGSKRRYFLTEKGKEIVSRLMNLGKVKSLG